MRFLPWFWTDQGILELLSCKVNIPSSSLQNSWVIHAINFWTLVYGQFIADLLKCTKQNVIKSYTEVSQLHVYDFPFVLR